MTLNLRLYTYTVWSILKHGFQLHTKIKNRRKKILLLKKLLLKCRMIEDELLYPTRDNADILLCFMLALWSRPSTRIKVDVSGLFRRKVRRPESDSLESCWVGRTSKVAWSPLEFKHWSEYTSFYVAICACSWSWHVAGCCASQVRFLEAQNRKLADELEKLKAKWGKETSQIKAMYQAELDEARKLLDDATKEKARLEVRVASLEEQLEESTQR